MNVTEHAFGDINTYGGGERPPCTGFILDALPEVLKPVLVENSQTGASTRSALSCSFLKTKKRKPKEVSHRHAFCVTCGCEKKAYDNLVGKDVDAHYPTIKTVKEVGGKRKIVVESRISNILFVREAEEIKSFVCNNVNLSHLCFYYRHIFVGARVVKEVPKVSDYQSDSLKVICASESDDIIVAPQYIH